MFHVSFLLFFFFFNDTATTEIYTLSLHDALPIYRINRTRVRTMMRRFRTALTAGDPTAAGNLLYPTMSAIDQAITKGVLHENTGNRYKSRLTLAYNAVKAKAAK